MNKSRFSSFLFTVLIFAAPNIVEAQSVTIANLIAFSGKVARGYDADQAAQNSLDALSLYLISSGYLLTKYSNTVNRFPSGAFSDGHSHHVFTSIANKDKAETITVDTSASGSNPDNGVRVSLISIGFDTTDFSVYQAWMKDIQASGGGFSLVNQHPSKLYIFKNSTQTITVGPTTSIGGGGTALSTTETADIALPFHYSCVLTYSVKTG